MRRLDANDLRRLKARDNHTNILYLARDWAVIAATIATALLVATWLEGAGASGWWFLPVALVAVAVIGAAQHQLGGAIHEGTHHLLFRNRRLNELVSDWCAAFPLYTSTYQFRVHHLAHHQFVNDPKRDPDIAQLKESDHWLDFPVAHIDVVRKLLHQLWLPNLMRYTIIRAKYSALGFNDSPFRDEAGLGSAWAIRAGILFVAGAPALVISLLVLDLGTWALAALAVCFAAIMIFYVRLPAAEFHETQLRPVVSHRATVLGRMSFTGAVYGALTVVEVLTGAPAWAYYGLFWILPLFTTFALFMVLRQWVQHGNADRGRLTNTRIFFVNPLVRYAIFPWGMDFHLPHHLYASVPHYRLEYLHRMLLADPEYRDKGVIVAGYFGGDDPVTKRPTAMSVIRCSHAPGDEVHIDDTALDYADVKDRAAIDRQVTASRRAASS